MTDPVTPNPPANPNPPAAPNPAPSARDLPIIGSAIGSIQDTFNSLGALKNFNFDSLIPTGIFDSVIDGTIVGGHKVGDRTVGGHREGAHPELEDLRNPNVPFGKKIGLLFKATILLIEDLLGGGASGVGEGIGSLFAGIKSFFHTETPDEKAAATATTEQTNAIKTAEGSLATDVARTDAPADPAVVAAQALQKAQDDLRAKVEQVATSGGPLQNNDELDKAEQALRNAATAYLQAKGITNDAVLNNPEIAKFQDGLIGGAYTTADADVKANKATAEAEMAANQDATVIADGRALGNLVAQENKRDYRFNADRAGYSCRIDASAKTAWHERPGFAGRRPGACLY
jgi:hypothetical protein